jgi:hypothetical protein
MHYFVTSVPACGHDPALALIAPLAQCRARF